MKKGQKTEKDTVYKTSLSRTCGLQSTEAIGGGNKKKKQKFVAKENKKDRRRLFSNLIYFTFSARNF